MSKKFSFMILIVIILIAAFLRMYKLGEVPPSPNWDEVALGYNAYSLMHTGKDEYGKFLPLILRSYDDYKPAVYAYFIIPAIKFFGLNVFSVRLPSAVFGIFSVIATYFLVYELFQKWNLQKQFSVSKVAFLSSFLLAVSPWHIQFSRVAFESNVGTAFNIFAALFFLKGLKKPIFLLVSIVLIGLNLYIYQSEKVFTPLLFLVMTLVFRKELLVIPKKYIVLTLMICFLALFSLIGFTLTNKDVFARAKGVSVFSNQTEFLKRNTMKLLEDRQNNDYFGFFLDNRRFVYTKEIIAGYISHFDINWLFFTGDLARHHAPKMGLLYLFELPFLLIGIYAIAFGNFDKKLKIFIFAWFLIAPIPASVTSGVPHAVRALNFLPIFQIFVGLGLIVFISSISKITIGKGYVLKVAGGQIKYLIFFTLFLFVIFNFLYYLDQYFVQQNYFNSDDWQYGYKETVFELKRIEDRYEKIVVSNKPHLDQSYMFFLFYLQYPPSFYQKESQKVSGGFKENHYYGRYEFRPIDWNKERKNLKILYIGRPDDFPSDTKTIKTINFLDGRPAIKIVEG